MAITIATWAFEQHRYTLSLVDSGLPSWSTHDIIRRIYFHLWKKFWSSFILSRLLSTRDKPWFLYSCFQPVVSTIPAQPPWHKFRLCVPLLSRPCLNRLALILHGAGHWLTAFSEFARNYATSWDGKWNKSLAQTVFFIYILSGMMGNLFVLVFSPNAITAGASAALYGMFASPIVVLRYASHQSYLQLDSLPLPLSHQPSR